MFPEEDPADRLPEGREQCLGQGSGSPGRIIDTKQSPITHVIVKLAVAKKAQPPTRTLATLCRRTSGESSRDLIEGPSREER